MIEKVRHHCGVFGVIGHPEAARLTRLGLYALQHRGQESAGIVSTDGKTMFERKRLGLVSEVFPDEKSISHLKGDAAIGHNRYSTTGTTLPVNTQPFLINFYRGQIAAAHNGNLVNVSVLRERMEHEGSIFRTTTDSEVVLHLIAHSRRHTIPEMIADALGRVKGAFSMVFLTKDMVIGVKDPFSFRPLVIGHKDDAHFIASESCAFDLIDVELDRCLKPGEMVVLRRGKEPEHIFPWGKTEPGKEAACIFEFIYFSRPDSIVFGAPVDKIRRRMGWKLAEEHPVDADIVISVPDSSNTAALGFSEKSEIPFELGLIRNHYVGRTFIQPTQIIRESGVKLKYNPVDGVLRDKRVVVVDDSIVRGTTSRQLVKMLRDSGAAEVHMRIASPPIVAPCYYGIDTPEKKQLIAANKSIDEIRKYLGADSLGYLSLEGMLSIKGLPPMGFCTACFGTEYPVPIQDQGGKNKMDNNSQ